VAPKTIAKKKLALCTLLALGFVGLIGAHEMAGSDARAVAPLALAVGGTLCFIAAGVLARRMMK
jgi:ABC-type Fe3+-siderophore transport system permease subunit